MRMTDQTANPVDIHVGQKIRLRRKQIRQSQGELGARLGISFQQIQKYERGTNRVSASMLVGIARAQELPIADYFEGLPDVKRAELSQHSKAASKWLASEEAWQVAEAMAELADPLRRAVLSLARNLARISRRADSEDDRFRVPDDG